MQMAPVAGCFRSLEKMISVIIPVYKSEKYIEQCIRSVMNQTYTDLEIIAIDDGSPDSSGVICDKLAKEDKRIVVIHQANGGVSAAQNAGLERAMGDYLVFLDGDDYLSPVLIERLFVTLQDNDVDMVMCDYIPFTGNSAEEVEGHNAGETIRYNTKEAIIELIKDEKIHYFSWGKIYKRSLFGDVRFPIGIRYDDVYIMHRVFANCSSAVYLPEALYYYRQHEGSVLQNRTLDLSLHQYEAYKVQREYVCERWPDLEPLIDEGECPYLISTVLYYYNEYAGDIRYQKKIEVIKAELKACRKRIRKRKRGKLREEINYLRAIYLEPIIRR